MALSNTVAIGVQDAVYSLYNKSAGTYGAVTSLAPLIEISFDPASSIATLFANNGPTEMYSSSIGEATLSFSVTDLQPQVIADLLGRTYANGIIEESSTDTAPIVALGGKILRTNGVWEYFWIQRAMLSAPATTSRTKESGIEFAPPVMEGRVIQNDDGVYRTRVRTDDPSASSTTLTNWFNQVVESTGASTTAVTVGTITGDDSANTITIPFAKSGETFSLKTISEGDISVSVVSTGALLAGTSTYAYSAAGTAPTITITNANIGAVAYLVTVTNDVTDNNNVHVTAYSQLVTPA
jgi:phi13 family phage major tail protein